MNDYTYFFYHIPKTGGQSFRNALGRSYKLHEELIHLSPWGEKKAKADGFLPFHQRKQDQRDKAKFIVGHHVGVSTQFLLSTEKVRFLTIIRHPAQQIVSRYNFNVQTKLQKPISFERWYRFFNVRNYQAYHLTSRYLQKKHVFLLPKLILVPYIKKKLSEFWFVGTTEYIDQDFPKLATQIGIKNTIITHDNVSSKKFRKTMSLTPEMEQRLIKQNSVDYAIYQHALILKKFFQDA